MRYTHVPRTPHTQRTHRRRVRLHLTSILLLAAVIVALTLALRTPLDHTQMYWGFLRSLYRVVIGYGIALVLAILLGLLTVSTRWAETLLLPVFDVAQSFPTFALLPILVFYFGHNGLSVIAILVIAMIWPIMFNVMTGVKEERRDQVEAARVFGARGWRFLLYYRWPMLLPWLVTGSIVSWGQAWDTIVGAEIIAGVTGAGHYLGTLGGGGQAQLLALGIAVYLFLIFVINQVVWLPLLHRTTRFQSES